MKAREYVHTTVCFIATEVAREGMNVATPQMGAKQSCENYDHGIDSFGHFK